MLLIQDPTLCGNIENNVNVLSLNIEVLFFFKRQEMRIHSEICKLVHVDDTPLFWRKKCTICRL